METASVSRRRSDEYSAYDADSDLACRENSPPAVETQQGDIETASEFLICHSSATTRPLEAEFAPPADDDDVVRADESSAAWPTQRPPTGNDLSGDPRVRQILSEAWKDSFKKAPGEKLPHEEGGWIYGQPGTTDLHFVRGPRGEPMKANSDHMEIDLRNPPVEAGWYVVADFHTHPGSTVDPQYAGDTPSRDDYESNLRAGVPGLVRTSNGGHLDTMIVEPPDRRRFGYSGPGGYPGYGQ
jgi:hypothetical protein